MTPQQFDFHIHLVYDHPGSKWPDLLNSVYQLSIGSPYQLTSGSDIARAYPRGRGGTSLKSECMHSSQGLSIDQDNGVVEAWSFNVKQGEDPVLISAKGNPEFGKQQAVRSLYDEPIRKALPGGMILLCRTRK